MSTCLDKLGGDRAHGAIICWEGFIELSHFSANCGLWFDQVDLKTLISKIQGCLHTRNSTTDDHYSTDGFLGIIDTVQQISFVRFTHSQIRKNLFKTYNNINPGNFYDNDYNTPNFVSNVTDVREYYEYNTYDNKTENEVPKTPYQDPKEIPNDTSQIIDKASLRPAYLHPEATGENLPMDQWYYKNELPMNGGTFGGITGFDDLGYANAVFSKDFIPTSPEMKQNDDLRNGMGTPQKQMYEYNMSMP